MKKLIDFYKSIPFLRNSTKTYLEKLNHSFEPKQFIRNQEIYKEGDPSDMVYLVKYGEFEITKRIKYSLKSESKEKEEFMKYLE